MMSAVWCSRRRARIAGHGPDGGAYACLRRDLVPRRSLLSRPEFRNLVTRLGEYAGAAVFWAITGCYADAVWNAFNMLKGL